MSDNIISDGPEWRSFPEGQVKGLLRAGPPITFRVHDQGLGVEFKARGYARLGFSRKPRPARVKKGDKPLVSMLHEVNNIAGLLELPGVVIETASMILRKVYYSARLRNHDDGLVAASILKAAELHGIPLPAGRVLDYLGCSERDLWRARRLLAEHGITRVADRRMRIELFIDYIVGSLKLDRSVASMAKGLLDQLGLGLARGRRSEAVAAALVYIAARLIGYDMSLRKCAETAYTSEGALRKIVFTVLNEHALIVLM